MDRLISFCRFDRNSFFNYSHVGWKKPNEEDLFEERDRRMRAQYVDPIEHFPVKIDQLSEAVKQVRISEE
jgi:hypothetical protein